MQATQTSVPKKAKVSDTRVTATMESALEQLEATRHVADVMCIGGRCKDDNNSTALVMAYILRYDTTRQEKTHMSRNDSELASVADKRLQEPLVLAFPRSQGLVN